MRWGITTLVAVIGLIHFHLWQDGYRTLPTIGPLFLVTVVLCRLDCPPHFGAAQLDYRWVLAACFATGTLVANLASLLLPHGLFEFKEVGVSYSGGIAIASELAVIVLFGVWSYGRLHNSRGPTRQRFSDRTRANRCCAHR